MDSLFSGVNFLIWLVGIGTLLAGAIGVSKHLDGVRTRAHHGDWHPPRHRCTPRTILSQILPRASCLLRGRHERHPLCRHHPAKMLEVGKPPTASWPHTSRSTSGQHLGGGIAQHLGRAVWLGTGSQGMSIKPVDAMRDE